MHMNPSKPFIFDEDNKPYKNIYVGGRYIAKFEDRKTWDKNRPYEQLTLVEYTDRIKHYYMSIRPVPDNIELTNTDYWIEIFKGFAGTIKIVEVRTGAPGTEASVVNVGTPEDAELIITIPRGRDPEIIVGETKTVEYPSDANVEIEDAGNGLFILDFDIPRGRRGETGPQGPQGPKGDTYTITEQDYENIANVVYGKLNNLDVIQF